MQSPIGFLLEVSNIQTHALSNERGNIDIFLSSSQNRSNGGTMEFFRNIPFLTNNPNRSSTRTKLSGFMTGLNTKNLDGTKLNVVYGSNFTKDPMFQNLFLCIPKKGEIFLSASFLIASSRRLTDQPFLIAS